MALDPAARGRSNRDAASSAEPLLRLEGICKRFGVLKANDEISLTLRAGEIHAIIGENGAGKTTLMNILYGIYQADSGTVLRHGEPLRLRSPSEAIKAGISLVSQHFLLIERHTVAENLALGLPQSGWWFARQRIARDVEILARDYGLDLDLNARVSDLAPGLRQRLEIVKALLRRSRILILDEPTSVLTPQEATRLFQVLRRLREQGCAIVFISHKLDEVLALSDRISVLRKGRLELTVDRAQASAAALSRAMIGSELAPPAPRAAAAESSVRLRVDGLRLGPRAGPVSFSVHRGEIFGIAGVAGNGQVELAQALTGLRPAGGARIALDGDDLEGLDPIGFREKGVAHIPEDRNHLGVVPSMTVEENVLLCWLHRPSFRRGPLLAWKDIGRVATDLIERYRIATPSRLTRTSLLSGGNVQKLILGRELLDRPRLIIAVHPTYGLDVQATAQVHRCFLEEAAEGAAVILISEDLEEIMSLSDRIGVLFNRTLMGIAPRAEARVERLGLWMAGDRS
jgi:simple sugar transport system ATP-binding protein